MQKINSGLSSDGSIARKRTSFLVPPKPPDKNQLIRDAEITKNSKKFRSAFRKFIRRKIDEEFEVKFKKMLKEAKDNFNGV